ncbi:MAG: YtxH domain-containing protein [Enterococcus sp.]
MIKGILKGLVFGSVVGAAGGLLLAPRSGNDTRKKLIEELDEATELTNNLNDSLQHFQQALVNTKIQAEELLPAFQKDVEKDIEAFKFQAEPRINQIQDQVQKITESIPQPSETEK